MRGRSRYLSFALAALLVGTAGAARAATDGQSIADAAQAHDKAAIRSLLSVGGDARGTQTDGTTALHWAAHLDDLELAALLIGAGADPSATNDYGATPLTLACTNGDANMVDALLAAGANPNAKGPSEETPLMLCARTGNAEAVSALLAKGADVHARDADRGQTALMCAAAQNHPEILRVLIAAGADIHARSTGGFSPLLFAVRSGGLESTEILLDAGADIEEAGPRGMTPLVLASVSGHEALGVFLLDKGANPDAQDDDGATALHYSALSGITAMNGVRYANYVDHIFRPSLIELVKSLLAHGADPNIRLINTPSLGGDQEPAGDGATPFVLAAATPDPEMMRLLVEAGADPLLATTANLTPLMAAAGVGRGQDYTEKELERALLAVRLEVEWGADVNAANDDGLTAMHGAASNGADEVVRYLVAQGANMDVWDKYQQTPLSVASGMRLPWIPYGDELGEIIQPSTAALLLELGATPLDTPEYFHPPEEDSAVYRINQGQRYDGVGAGPGAGAIRTPQPGRVDQ
nr:MAG: ankyrin repeat domain-containing protein [Hyphomicrobiales bacterium]